MKAIVYQNLVTTIYDLRSFSCLYYTNTVYYLHLEKHELYRAPSCPRCPTFLAHVLLCPTYPTFLKIGLKIVCMQCVESFSLLYIVLYGSGCRKMYNWGWTGKNNKTHNYFKQLLLLLKTNLFSSCSTKLY